MEMKQREAATSRQSEQLTNTTVFMRVHEAVAPPPQQLQQQQQLQLQHQQKQQQQLKQRAWTWDDSLRSNSDRFLETLEEDLPSIVADAAEAATATAAVADGRMRLSLTSQRRMPLHVTFQEVQGRRHSFLPLATYHLPACCMQLSRATFCSTKTDDRFVAI